MQPELDPNIGWRLEAHANELKYFAEQDAEVLRMRCQPLGFVESCSRLRTIRRLKHESLELLSIIALWNFERLCKYGADQPRDNHGRWTSGGGDSASNDIPDNADNLSGNEIIGDNSAQPGTGNQIADSGQIASDVQVDGGEDSSDANKPDMNAAIAHLQNEAQPTSQSQCATLYDLPISGKLKRP